MSTGKTEVRRVVLYARVSTAEQAEKDLSLPAQLKAMRQFAAQRELEVVAEYVEPGASGRDDNRPEFRRMMQDILAPSAQVDALLVVHTSRFMRDVTKAVVARQRLTKRGIRVISTNQETTDDASGRLMETICMAFDQYESEMNGSRTSSAMRENARRGYVNGSAAPFGYRAQLVEVGSSPRRKLVPDLEEAKVVAELFKLYVARGGAKTVAMELNQLGYRCRKDRLWNKDLVLKVVEESAAIGTYYWGKSDKRRGGMRDRSEWIAIPVEPIIGKTLFDTAQKIRDARDPKRNPGRTGSSPLMLAGILRCGKCDASYILETSGKLNANGEPYRYYNCRTFLKSGKGACAGHRLSVEKVDRAVLDHFASQLFTVEHCRKLVHDVVEESGTLRRKTDEQRRELQNQVEDLDRRIGKWKAALESHPDYGHDVILPRMRELQAKRDEVASGLAKIIPLRPPPPDLFAESTIRRFQETLRQLLLSADTALAKNYLRFLAERITVHQDRLNVVGRRDPAVALLAAGSRDQARAVNHPDEVLVSVGDWLQLLDSNQGPGD